MSAGAGEAGAVEGRRKKREGGSWDRKGTPTLGRGPGHLPAREPPGEPNTGRAVATTHKGPA